TRAGRGRRPLRRRARAAVPARAPRTDAHDPPHRARPRVRRDPRPPPHLAPAGARGVNARTTEILGVLAALLISVAASIAITWPMVEYLDQVVLGGGELGGWLWRYDWHFRSLDGLMRTDLGPFALWKAFVSVGRYP